MNRPALKIVLFSLLVVSMAGIYAMLTGIKVRNPLPTQKPQISANTLQLLITMNNDEVIWAADYFGINPLKLTGATLLLYDSKEDINPLLIDTLLDEDKFVAAHVLLTFRTSAKFQRDDVYIWNSLKIQYTENGFTFEGNDLYALQEFWLEKLQLGLTQDASERQAT